MSQNGEAFGTAAQRNTQCMRGTRTYIQTPRDTLQVICTNKGGAGQRTSNLGVDVKTGLETHSMYSAATNDMPGGSSRIEEAVALEGNDPLRKRELCVARNKTAVEIHINHISSKGWCGVGSLAAGRTNVHK